MLFRLCVLCKAILQEYNCYSQIKEQYKSNLENGFLDKDGSYHPALKPAAYCLLGGVSDKRR